MLLAPGLAALIGRYEPKTYRRLMPIGGMLVGWNLMLLGVYRHGIGGSGGASPGELLALVSRYVAMRPLEAIGVLLAAGWLTATLVAAFRDERKQAAAPVQEPPLRMAA